MFIGKISIEVLIFIIQMIIINKKQSNNSYVEKWRDGPYETSATSF